MDNPKHYSFSIIRYVPDLVREEFLNIGVLVVDPTEAEPPIIRLTQDWTRLRFMDPYVDIEVLQAIQEELPRRLAEKSEAESLFSIIQDSLSTNLQISHERGRAADSITSLAEELMIRYVLPPASNTLFALAVGR